MTDRSGDRFVQSGEAVICVEAFGAPGDPAFLLMGGSAASMDFWEDEFCLRLAAAGRDVVIAEIIAHTENTTGNL